MPRYQSLKAELRHQIWQSVQRDPRWRTSTHRNRKAIAKKLFWEIWGSTEDKESLAQGLGWLQRKQWDSSGT